MTERGAELLRRGRADDRDPEEVWEAIKELNEEIDWDIQPCEECNSIVVCEHDLTEDTND